MSYRWLKVVRVITAVTFFVLITLLFVDFGDIGAGRIADGVLYLQFVPSCINFIKDASLGAAGFLFVLGGTVLFGRGYCSFVCPLGTLQDVIIRAAGAKPFRTGGKRPGFSFSAPHNGLRYAILALTVLLLLGGSGLMLNLLDPFSSFGRILANVIRPVIIAGNNLAASISEFIGYSGLYPVRFNWISPFSLAVSLFMLLIVGFLSAGSGRLYCNSVCPVGTLLGLFSSFSLFRIHIDHSGCIGCGICERRCKAGCIDSKGMTVDATRCIGCFNCLSDCPDNAIRIVPTALSMPESGKHGTGRRKFLTVFAALGLGVAAARVEAQPPLKIVQSRPTEIPETRTVPISPPGSESIAHFTAQCTACHLCVSACPSRILVPSFLDYGFNGIMMPQMSFHLGHCNFDCTVCSEICPSGAILPLKKENKRRTQVGVAKFIRDNCVVYTDKTNCGACSEHCPTKAVHMVPYMDLGDRKLVIPEVNESLCVGCGGCEHACPTKPFKAIYVNGNAVHKVADKPLEKPLALPAEDGEDFPF